MSRGTSQSIRAIETEYAGYRFRSRLEARWAVFFENLAIPYRYEAEGFDLGEAGWYLPDFWLPEQKCWVEIKPEAPDKKEASKLSALARGSGFNAFCFWGEIPLPDEDGNTDTDSAYLYRPDDGGDIHYQWCICTLCGRIGIQFDGRSSRLPCPCPGERERGKCYTGGHVDLLRAYRAARSARFEHYPPNQRRALENARWIK